MIIVGKPSAAATLVDVCFISMRGYGCLETGRYTTPGVYTRMHAMGPANGSSP